MEKGVVMFRSSFLGTENDCGLRNTYIDMLRGIAALGIISIHTAFWSGESYTPIWFRSVTLMLDVPFFFFLSGWGSSCRDGNVFKAAKSLWRIWLKWIFFISVLEAVCLFGQYLFIGHKNDWGGAANARELVRNYMFQGSFTGFPVVLGSVWFIPYYFIVVLFNTVILLGKREDAAFKKLYCILLAVLSIWVNFGNYFFGVNINVLFYGFFWMLGYLRSEIKIQTFPRLAAVLIFCAAGYVCSGYVLELSWIDIQSAKFPPSIMYAFSSLVFIAIAVYLEPYIKKHNRWLVHIGQNAVFYFFGQGVGSSFIFHIVHRLNVSNWFLKWMAVYLCNLVITCITAEGVAYLYKKCSVLWHMKIERRNECFKN